MSLSLCHLSCCANGKTLISGICLDLAPGKLYGLVGPNGSGKTTLLKAITGIWPIATGELLWRGKPLFAMKREQLCQIITYVPQHPPLNFDFTVREMASMGRYAQERRYERRNAAVERALAAVDLSHCSERPISALSSGERQRAYIARGLVAGAPIILLDEPTASLDIRHQLEIWQLLRELALQGHTVAIAHHDLATAALRCDELIVLHERRCMAVGPATTVLTPPLVATVFGISISPQTAPLYGLLSEKPS